MGFGALRVLNEERLPPGGAVPSQRRANMELVDIVLGGQLAWRDDHGGAGVLQAGDVRWTGAGRGIEVAESNPDPDVDAHVLRIWLQPDRLNAAPASLSRRFDPEARRGRWALLLSPDGADGSIAIRLQARLQAIRLQAGVPATFALDAARRYWLHVAAGDVEAAGQRLGAGDALGFETEGGALALAGIADHSEVLLFDLPG